MTAVISALTLVVSTLATGPASAPKPAEPSAPSPAPDPDAAPDPSPGPPEATPPPDPAAPADTAAAPSADTAAPRPSVARSSKPTKDPDFERRRRQRERSPGSKPTPHWGGFGFFAPGILIASWGDFEEVLQDRAALGPDANFAPVALMIGGGGRSLLAGRWLLGGKGFGFFVPSDETSRGRARFAGGGGGFELGLVIYNKRNWLLYPTFGIGGMGLGLTVENLSAGGMTIGTETIGPGEELQLESGFAVAEFGFGFTRTLFWGTGGIIHGGEIGVMMSVSKEGWERDGASVGGIPAARLLGAYLRINTGGGGFGYQ